ncbi:tripartite tricarboxylate transporter permease [Candidatus Woesearchaeota archaeon]|nr:tripartite tricarboxylate transporter permease [Candidatus Woesearchaeota archaeon]
MLSIFIAILIGTSLGIITGLTPGIHINLVSIIIISLLPKLTLQDPLLIVLTITSMSITHTFLDIIPSTFLGVPSEETALSILPTHKFLLEGRGYEAVRIATLGSLLGLISTIAITPILIPVLKFAYDYIKTLTPYILILATIILILKEKNKIYTILIFFLAGILGIYTLNTHLINQPLFPLFTGLFGTAGLILSLKDNTQIPKQRYTIPKINGIYKILPKGLFASTLTGFLPGLGSAQAAIIATSTSKDKDPKNYIFLIGSINTIVMIVGLITFYTINKSRNGSVIAISKLMETLTINNFIIIIASILITGSIATFLALKISKIFAKVITKINYRVLCKLIISFLSILVLFISGTYGLLLLITATALGVIPPLLKVSRHHLMGSLILPIILFLLL